MFSVQRFPMLVYLIFAGPICDCDISTRLKVFAGYRCFVGNQIASRTQFLHRYSCRYDCMAREWCSVVNENLAEGYCLLFEGPCFRLIPNSDFQGILISKTKQDACLEWKPFRESHNPAKMENSCSDQGYVAIVGRLFKGSHLLPGNGLARNVFTSLNGAMVFGDIQQSLDVQPDCDVTWMPFTGGDLVPEGAMEGGYLDNNGVSQPLYIMSAEGQRGCSVYGYYNPSTGTGYIEYFGVHQFTQMNVLVLNWTWTVINGRFNALYND